MFHYFKLKSKKKNLKSLDFFYHFITSGFILFYTIFFLKKLYPILLGSPQSDITGDAMMYVFSYSFDVANCDTNKQEHNSNIKPK